MQLKCHIVLLGPRCTDSPLSESQQELLHGEHHISFCLRLLPRKLRRVEERVMTRIPAAQREPLAIAVALQPNLPSPWLALLRKGCVSVAPLCTPHAPRLSLPPPLPRRDALPPEKKRSAHSGFLPRSSRASAGPFSPSPRRLSSSG